MFNEIKLKLKYEILNIYLTEFFKKYISELKYEIFDMYPTEN